MLIFYVFRRNFVQASFATCLVWILLKIIHIKDGTFLLLQGTTNGDADGEAHDESVMNVDAEDDVDNLQLAWEMLGE